MAIDSVPDWYKDAVIYQVHVKSFFDADNDGAGDFPGITEKLDYIASLGVNTVWLLPFYPSPRRDDGYDIADYRDIHPQYGTFDDFRRFIDAAHERGLRVVTELVVNHTSDQHPWFQRARRAPPGSPERDFYVWRDDDKGFGETRIIFIDTEKSNWAWDEVAGAYYWHRFYSHQPDLNFDNPEVMRELMSVLHFWLETGVDGLRLDAVPYLVEREGTNNENLPETHDIIRRIRAEIDARYTDRMLLAEANQWPEDVQEYFGKGDECHMSFHFPLMPRMYMAVAREDRYPITDILRQTPQIPDNCQWAIFLRNHDELTLEMVTDQERDYLWDVYASDPRARINLGIRRRLAPLMDRDRRRIELMTNLLLSMPGTPVMYYGDEIGMGDNIFLGDRDGVRTPMQWSPDRNGGFSRADPARLILPPIMDPLYGYNAVNVEAQSADPHSLLNWVRRMVGIRQARRTFGRGELKFLYPGNRKVLAYIRELEGESILCVSNLSQTAQSVELDLAAYARRVPIELMGRTPFPPVGELPYLVTLPPYGFFWFLLAADAEVPAWHTPQPVPMPDYITFVLRHGLQSLLASEQRALLEGNVLPAYLPLRRWFGSKGTALKQIAIAAATPMPAGDGSAVFAEISTGGEEGDRYLIPLALAWDAGPQIGAATAQLALARARQVRRVGYLTDATSQDAFVRAVLAALLEGRRLPDAEAGEVVFRPAPKLGELELPAEAEIGRSGFEQSNTSVTVDSKLVLKFVRRTFPGPHPEAEMGRYLTEVAGFAPIAAFLGDVVRVQPDGSERLLAIAQAFVRNQGDGATWLRDQLKRALTTPPAGGDLPEEDAAGLMMPSRLFITALGTRIAQLHLALARPTADPAFAPEGMGAEDIDAWVAAAEGEFAALSPQLQAMARGDSGPAAALAADLLSRSDELGALIGGFRGSIGAGLKTRIHGDLHLGQVLVVAGDAVIVDFEGEPSRPLDERRAKSAPARDVAGMLRSFDYAARMVVAEIEASHTADGAATIAAALEWRAEAVDLFLDAYFETIGDHPVWPREHAGRETLIVFFTLWKAIYELGYELGNRPQWANLPLQAILDLLGRAR